MALMLHIWKEFTSSADWNHIPLNFLRLDATVIKTNLEQIHFSHRLFEFTTYRSSQENKTHSKKRDILQVVPCDDMNLQTYSDILEI